MAAKKVVKVEQRMHGHAHVYFDDGTNVVYDRNHEHAKLKVGDVIGGEPAAAAAPEPELEGDGEEKAESAG